MKFKSNIEVQAGIEDKDGQVGSNGQILASTGSQVDWVDPANIVTSATDVIIECKNTSGVTIAKGTPVYQTGNVGATAVIEVAVADASDEDKMAAIGLLQSDLINNAFGYVVVTGELLNITTSPIDGVTPTTGDTIYVKPGGGLTLTKPTGVNFIQNVGLVGKVSGGNAGSLTVSSIMRSNDVPTPLYIDHDNQRLGVGATSPSQKLDVSGIIAVNGVKFLSTIGSESYIWNNTGGLSVVDDTGNTVQLRIKDNGNVGIGTTNPRTKLHVTGLTGDDDPSLGSSTAPLFVSNTADSYGLNIGVQSSGTSWLQSQSNSSSIAYDLSLNPLGGNVGVGTTSPSEKLVVDGKIRSLGGTSSADFYSTGNDALIVNNGTQNLKFWNNGSERMRIKGDGNVGIGTTSPTAKVEVLGVDNDSILKLTRGNAPQYLTFRGYQMASNGNHMLVSADDAKQVWLGHQSSTAEVVVDVGGNVGIGTTSPDSQLEVYYDSAGSTGAQIKLGSGDVGYETTITNYRRTTDSTFEIASYDDTILGYNRSTDKTWLGIGTNVGIGTTSPSARLEVSSSGANGILISKDPNSTSNSGRLFFETDTVSEGFSFLNSNGLMTIRSQAQAGATSGNVRVAIDSSGNVGIGVTAPVAKLDVLGTSGGPVVFDYAYATNAGLRIHGDESAMDIVGTDVGNHASTILLRNGNEGFGLLNNPNLNTLQFRSFTATADAFSIHNTGSNLSSLVDIVTLEKDGNVGIGTTSPSTKLNISSASFNDHITLTRSTDELGISVSGGQLMFEGGVSPFNNNNEDLGRSDKYWKELFVYSVRSGGGLQFKTSGNNERMRITSAGNVGIGTTNPSSKLQVAGGIQMADDTDTASATKVGTMRYRTATNEPVPVTGTDLVINGDFSNGTTGWSFGAGWAVSNGGATVSTAGVTTDVRQAISYVANISAATKFRYRFEITNITAGSLRLFVSKPTFTQIANVNAVGVYEYVVEVSTGSNGMFYLYSTSSSGNTFQGTVTNVSVLEVTEEDASYADMCMQTGSSTYEWVNIVRNTY